MPSEAESFLGVTPHPSEPPPEPDGIRLGGRFFVLAITWFTALFVTHPDIRAFPGIYLFPIGLGSLLDRILPPKSDGSLVWIIIGWLPNPLVLGWLFYGALSAGILLSSKRLWFFVFYALLTILLITNVAGCREMLSNSKTH